MTKRWLRSGFGLFLLLLVVGGATAQDHPAAKDALDRVLDSLTAMRHLGDVALSPDGRSVAWVEAQPRKENESTAITAIYVGAVAAPTATPRRLATADGVNLRGTSGLAWSPDSRRLAFLSETDKEGQLQVHMASAAEGPVRKLTNLKGFLAVPAWSPDGKQLALLVTEGAVNPPGPVQPAARETGVIEEHVPIQRLHLVDAESGHSRPVSPPDLHVYEYDWSPDGKKVVVIAAPGPGDNNWYIAQLHLLELGTGRLKSLLKPAMQIAVPRWSPDGGSIAFIGGLMSDEGANGGEVYSIPATGGMPRNLTPGLKASATWLAWYPDGSRILFAEHIDGGSGLAALDLAGGGIKTLWTGPETISTGGSGLEVSVSRSRETCALLRQSFQKPPEVWAGPVGAWRQVTHVNQDVRPQWGEARSLHWRCDGQTVQGWLLYPHNYDPKRRYPMVVSVHGGPAWATRPRWPRTFFDTAVLASQSYFVFFPNPRGSYGQGEAFTRANVKDFGHGDLRDILAGVDDVLKTAPIDPERLGIAGWSYGGYMTMWAVTQTTRFRAAVAGAGIANWQSYYGENGIDQWLIPYFGATVYDDPAVYARSSPINFIKRVRTPTLVLVGERDEECPAPQSREFWHALKTLGVPTQLVIYPDEGHSVGKQAHRRDIMRRTVAWLNERLREDRKPSPPAPPRP